MSALLPFGPGAWLFVGLYLCSLLWLGWLGRRAREHDTLRDFYLGGRGFGFVVLFFTLFATQYSGNSFFGAAGAAYRQGFTWLISVHYMLAVIVFYRSYATPLRRLARERDYVTPVDFLRERFDSPWLSLIASIVMIVALNNYLLAQLMTMGRALQGLAGPYGDIAYNYGVLGLAAIMLTYGTLGGMRAVAWTDAIQGIVLLGGFIALLGLLVATFGPLTDATELILSSADADKITPPSASMQREWLSYLLIVGIGGALYPQAIQRIYAARSGRALNRSFALMAFMPYFSALVAVIAGIYALAYVTGLEGANADQALASIMRLLQDRSVLGYALVVLIFSAVLAALMSTADSAMLSISSMFTKDIYGVHLRRQASESELTKVGKRCSWVVVGVLAMLAIALKDETSLIGLIDRKFDLLVQLGPAFMLGVHWNGLRAGPVFAGLLTGLAIALTLAFAPLDFVVDGKVWSVHPGLYGLAANLAIALLGSRVLGRARKRGATHIDGTADPGQAGAADRRGRPEYG